MMQESHRKALLTYSGRKLNDEVPAGVRAVYEDVQRMKAMLPGGSTELIFIALLGLASDMERPHIPTVEPQVATVKPNPPVVATAKKAKRRGHKPSAEERKATSDRMKKYWADKKAAVNSDG